MSQLRREKLRELFKEEVGDILQRQLKDPRIGFVSVTDAEVSADLRHVKIYVSVLGDAEAKRQTMAVLERATGFVRSELGKRVKLRYTPEVLFRLDESIERGTRVVALLRDVMSGGRLGEAEDAGPSGAEPEPPRAEEDDDPSGERDARGDRRRGAGGP